MTGPLVLDDTSLQIQEGTDTLTVNWPTGTADRTISFPDADGTVALTTDVNTPGDGTLTITAGTNISSTVTGGAFTANKADATTITLNVDDVFVLTDGDTMTGNLVMDTANIQGDVNAITAGAGATFQYAANTPPNITEFPALIPFYCPNNTTIFIGTPTVNIV